MKPLVIYHANCADGFGAAFAAWLKLGDEAEFEPQQYGSTQEELPVVNGRDVYILDFSYPKPWMDLTFATAKRVVWLDHHKTAFEMWAGKNYLNQYQTFTNLSEPHHITLDNNKSGAILAWEYFHPGTEVPMLIKHIDDYDRWQFKLAGTKAFQKALWSYAPWDFAQWKEMFWNEAHNEDFSIEATGLIEEGEAILRAHEQNVQAVVKGAARECVIELYCCPATKPYMYTTDASKGQNKSRNLLESYCGVDLHGLAANCPPHLQSDVGHELATQSDTFGLCWHIDKDNVVRCSLRSNGNYDVSAIAKAFGGGGHKNAAGFEVPLDTLIGWLK